MGNIFLLPTDKPTILHFDDKLFLSPNYQYSKIINSIVEGRNIYITSDEEIKERDWITNGLSIRKANLDSQPTMDDYHPWKKIILTTDQDLIKEGVQAIDDTFLEWFVNNPSCEEVEVKIKTKWKTTVYDQPDMEDVGYTYKINIPKEKSISYEEFKVKASEGLSEESDDENRFYALGKELDNKLEEEPKCLYDTPKSCENSECRVLNKCNGDRVRPKQENFSWGKLVKEAGSEEELIKILKLPHIAPLIREAMRNNCKK